jgi:hypothetical protein
MVQLRMDLPYPDLVDDAPTGSLYDSPAGFLHADGPHGFNLAPTEMQRSLAGTNP